MIAADLNIYSTFSGGKLSIPRIVDLFGERGFGAIAITDRLCDPGTWLGKTMIFSHRALIPAMFPLYLEILRTEAERAWKYYRMALIPGVELIHNPTIGFGSTHIIGLGVSGYVAPGADVTRIARAIHAQGGIACRGATNRESRASLKTALFCERSPEAIFGAVRRTARKHHLNTTEEEFPDAVQLGTARVARRRWRRGIESLHDLAVPQALPSQLTGTGPALAEKR